MSPQAHATNPQSPRNSIQKRTEQGKQTDIMNICTRAAAPSAYTVTTTTLLVGGVLLVPRDDSIWANQIKRSVIQLAAQAALANALMKKVTDVLNGSAATHAYTFTPVEYKQAWTMEVEEDFREAKIQMKRIQKKIFIHQGVLLELLFQSKQQVVEPLTDQKNLHRRAQKGQEGWQDLGVRMMTLIAVLLLVNVGIFDKIKGVELDQ